MPDLWGFIDTPEIQWRLATSDPITRLHRGVGLRKGDMSPELEQRFVSALESGIGDPDLASDLLAHMERDGTGLGGFWAHSKDGPWLAEGFSRRVQPSRWQNDPADYSVVMGADWDGNGSHYDWDTDPDYRKLLPGAKIRVNSVRISSPKHDWLELGGDQERHAHRTAMAWQDWAPHIEKECRDCEWDFEGRKTHQHLEPDWNYSGGNPMRYVIEHPTRYPGRSTLDYGHYLDDDDKPFLGIHMIETDPEFQHDGVAESLMRKLHEDYPGVPIDPGGMTDDGKGFKESLEKKIPESKSILRQRPSYATARRDFLAMAWDEWADKIVHTPPEKDGTLLGNQGSYEVTHENEEDVSGLLYSLNAEGPEDNSIFIDSLYTHPKFRDQGLAEALMRRLHQEYPDRRINPGYMTGDGQAFHDRMIEKEPSAKDLVTAANRILVAMAWQDWAPKIQHYAPGRAKGKGFYSVDHGNGITSDLSYTPDHQAKTLDIGLIGVNKRFQGDGLAEALVRRLHEDHPGYTINTGYMTPEGQGFHDRMLEKEPAARDLVTARKIMLAMAWEDYKDKIQGGCRACYDGWEGRYTIPQAGAFLNYTHGTHNGNPSVKVDGIYTHPSDRGKGVMEALIRRLVEDHPGTHISPGMMTTDGQKFHDRMLEKDPGAKDIVTAANWVLQSIARNTR